jgi:hypothetical protein
MYAAPRVDIPELQFVRKQFRAKYGKKFEEDAMANVRGVLNERVITKLSVEPPAAYLVQTYLHRSCEKYEVDWSPSVPLNVEQMGEPMAPPVGFSVPIARGTGLGPIVALSGATTVGDEEITYDGGTAQLEPPKAPTSFSNGGSAKDDFAEPDIFIPVAPGQSQTSKKTEPSKSATPSAPPSAPSAPSSAPSAPSASSEISDSKGDVDDDDDKDDSNPPSSSDGGTGTSYRDLAARFDNLKNL